MTDTVISTGSARRRRTLMVTGALAVVSAMGGCSSAASDPPQSAPPTAAATPVIRATTSAADGETVTAIRTAYTKFFNSSTSLKDSMTLLQNGPAFRGTLKKQAKTSFAKATTVTVSTVTLNTQSKATVVYTILLSGKPALVDTVGAAINERGTWKVAAATFCGLLTAQGPPPPVCA